MSTTTTMLWILAGLAVAGVLAWLYLRREQPVAKPRDFNADDWQPRTMRPLTPTELRVLMHLREALPECLLMPQISLSRFLQVGQNRSYHQWFSGVGRRTIDFLVCSKQGDVLGAVQLSSSAKRDSEGTQRKLKTLALAKIPVWQMKPGELPNIDSIRLMVMTELAAAEQHSQLHSQQGESEWQATELQPRVKTGNATMPGVEAVELEEDRWNQPWATEDARPSAYLDEFEMIEVPQLVHKGSARTHGEVR
jgi:hypothetical protein